MRHTLLICLTAVLLLYTAVASAEQTTLRVGVITPLQGPTAFFGDSIVRGITLAVEEANRTRPNTIEVTVEGYDYQNLKAVAGATSKLINVNRVDALFTTWAEDTEIAVPLASSRKIPIIAMAAGSRGLTRRSEWLFRIWPSDESFIKAEVQFAVAKGMKSAVMIAAQSAYFTSLAELTTESWLAKTGAAPQNFEVSPAESNFSSIVTRIQAIDPDVVFLRLPLERVGLAAAQLRKQGVRAQFFSTQESDSDPVLTAAGGAAEGMIFPSYESASTDFIAAHKERFGSPPGVAAEYGYDAVKLVISAKANGNQQIDLRQALINLPSFDGASGEIKFDETRDRLPKRVLLKKISGKDGVEIPM